MTRADTTRALVLEALHDGAESAAEVATATGRNVGHMRAVLHHLARLGDVEVERRGGAFFYRPKDNDKEQP